MVTNRIQEMCPERILKLTRQLLRTDSDEDTFQAFLAEVSIVFFECTGCDALEIIHHLQGINYHWTTEHSSGSHGKYQLFPDNINSQTFDSANTKSSILPHNASAHSQANIPFTLSNDNYGVLTLFAANPDVINTSLLTVLEEMILTYGWVASEHLTMTQLRERNRKQSCLCEISKIIEQRRPYLEYYGTEGFQSLLMEIICLLVTSCQHSNDISIKITLDDTTHTSKGFTTGQNIRKANISIVGKTRGSVEIHCHKENAQEKCQLFLSDEQNLVDEAAQLIGLLVEKHEATEARKLLQKQVQHADRLATLGELAAGVAHEINEPLGNILGFTQLVSQGLRDCDYKLDEIGAIQTKQDLDRIVAATLHTREIVRDLLIFARQVPPKQAELDINQQIDLALSFFLSRCANAGIRLRMRKADNLPIVIADQTQINQVIVNLVTNAIHAMPDGGDLTIETGESMQSEILSSPSVFIRITDTGVGISKCNREKVFQPFFTTKDAKRGTGLGLSVVHSIIKSHGGKITVDSELGAGTTFTVFLPQDGLNANCCGANF